MKFIQAGTEKNFFSGSLKDRIYLGVCYVGVMPGLLGFPCLFMRTFKSPCICTQIRPSVWFLLAI